MEEKLLWMRLGTYLTLTSEEAGVILGPDEAAASAMVKKVVAEGRFRVSGDSYIPACAVDSFNKIYGGDAEIRDIEFDF